MTEVKSIFTFVLLTVLYFVFKVSTYQLTCFEGNLGRQTECKVTKGISS